MIQAILTDIEGTTSSIDFVHQTLFPYARAHLRGFLREQAGDPQVQALIDDVEALVGWDLSLDEAADHLEQWMAEDRKLTPLKALQGLIWARGYASGALSGHVYADAVDGLRRWHARGLRLYVYSSGSVEAQRLIFGHSTAGDLTPLFSGYFDTRVGGKREVASYQAIARQIALPPAAILFLSDIGAELDAARSAGLATCQLLRPQDRTVPAPGHPQAADFAAVPV
ncbi:MAG TPA: acireductone synthase [Nevskiaceae bacterium]|nr:acireductone synthase [Nevskiaceae bacterium]